MAGLLMTQNNKQFRVGQDFAQDYGHGVCVFEVTALTPVDYEERYLGNIRFEEVRGPHTINLIPGGYVFDWYEEKFSLLAGVRRLRARARRRWPGQRH